MRRATSVATAGHWPAEKGVASVTLAYDDRHRRRLRLLDDDGAPFMLDLEEATQLGDGDGLALTSGDYVQVRAAAEPCIDIRCAATTERARLAWHIGNRHVPLQILPDGTMRIRRDHVIAAMLESLGATLREVTAPFAPESGAYAKHHHAPSE